MLVRVYNCCSKTVSLTTGGLFLSGGSVDWRALWKRGGREYWTGKDRAIAFHTHLRGKGCLIGLMD